MLLMIPAATTLLTLERESRELYGGWWRRDQSAGQDVLLQLQEQLVPGGQQIIAICLTLNSTKLQSCKDPTVKYFYH